MEWYERYGVSTRPVPADYAEFQAKFRHICSDVLELTPPAARALDIAARGAGAANLLPGAPELFGRAAGMVMAPPLRVLMYGCLPEVPRRTLPTRCLTAVNRVYRKGVGPTA